MRLAGLEPLVIDDESLFVNVRRAQPTSPGRVRSPS